MRSISSTGPRAVWWPTHRARLETIKLFTLDTDGVPGTAEAGDLFGDSTALADFNGDHCADLAVGDDGGTVQGGKPETGFVVVLDGSTAGITTDGAQLSSEDSLFGTGSGQNGEGFGGALASGDLNDDGYPDLVVGAPSESVGGVHGGGVAVIYGSASGLNQGSTPAGWSLRTLQVAEHPGGRRHLRQRAGRRRFRWRRGRRSGCRRLRRERLWNRRGYPGRGRNRTQPGSRRQFQPEHHRRAWIIRGG